MKVIGVTGTNGKTSTTVLIYDMLTGMGKNAAICGTLGMRYGNESFDVTLTTPTKEVLQYHMDRMAEQNVEYFVMEVSSHALQQDRVRGIAFDVGIFTNLTQDHLDYHKTMEEYKQAKRKLLSKSKSMVFNIDDMVGAEFFHEFYTEERPGDCITIGAACDCADITASHIETSLLGTEFDLNFLQTKSHMKIPLVGKFSVYNFMSAISALHLLGFSYDEIMASAEDVKPIRGRAQIIPLEEDFTVMLDYAHTPDALENILSSISEFHRGRIVTVFGCGGDRDRTKRPLMGAVASKYSDFIYLTSDNPRTEDPLRIMTDILPSICEGGKPYRAIENRERAITEAIQNAMSDDLVLIAGKGHETYQILGNEKVKFDEEEIILKALHF